MINPTLPDPDETLLKLDKLARESNSYEYGLPFMGEGILCDALPLSEIDDDNPTLEKLRDVLRAYGKACAAAALEAAAIKMEIAVDHLTSMSEGRGLIPGAAEGYKMALLVIEPMFREFIDARNLKD
jgi:hypothetical protein